MQQGRWAMVGVLAVGAVTPSVAAAQDAPNPTDGGAPGRPAAHPSLLFWAGPGNLQSPAATPLGGVVEGTGTTLRLDLAGLSVGSPVVLVSNAAEAPIPVGTVDAKGELSAQRRISAPIEGEDWWFAVVCPPGTTDCGTGERYSAVTPRCGSARRMGRAIPPPAILRMDQRLAP